MSESISKKDEMMLSLLGRLVFPEEKLKTIITKNKRNPDAYLRGYNSCDGTRTLTDIAKVIGVNQSTLNPIINDWEVQGIIYEVESNRGKTYRCLYKISGVKEKPSTDSNSNETNNIPKEEVKKDEPRTTEPTN